MRTSDQTRLVLLLLPPLLAGLVLGANQTRAGAYLSWPLSISYWVSISLVTWWLLAIGTAAARWFLRPWSPPEWVSWLVGAIAGSLAARPLIYAIASVLRPMMEAPILREMPPLAPTLAFFAYYVTNWSVVIIMWLAACWLADRWNPNSSQRSPTMTGEGPTEAGPAGQAWENHGFLSRIPPSLGRTILALHSEDHYVRVYTDRGETLVLAAISDAIRAVEAAGTAGNRVHRSWWVATAAVARSEASGRKLAVHLSNGIEVPISQTYREVAKISGLIPSGAKAG